MGIDFPIGECAVCVTLWNAEQPKRIIVQPASVITGGTGVCRRHLRYVRTTVDLNQAAGLAARNERTRA